MGRPRCKKEKCFPPDEESGLGAGDSFLQLTQPFPFSLPLLFSSSLLAGVRPPPPPPNSPCARRPRDQPAHPANPGRTQVKDPTCESGRGSFLGAPSPPAPPLPALRVGRNVPHVGRGVSGAGGGRSASQEWIPNSGLARGDASAGRSTCYYYPRLAGGETKAGKGGTEVRAPTESGCHGSRSSWFELSSLLS